MEKFLERQKPLELCKEETDHLNRTITNKEIKLVKTKKPKTGKLPIEKSTGSYNFIAAFYKTFKESMQLFTNSFRNRRKTCQLLLWDQHYPSFMRAALPWKANSDTDITGKKTTDQYFL